MGGYSRGSVRFFALLALLFGALAGCGSVWANGNVSADEVPPLRPGTIEASVGGHDHVAVAVDGHESEFVEQSFESAARLQLSPL